MRAFVIILSVVLLFGSVEADAAGNREAKESRGESSIDGGDSLGALLYCDSMTHDFGTIDRRVEEVWHTFTIENRGDEPLIIKRVDRSCSCMKVSISRRPIDPGDSRDMKVTYEVRKMPPGLFSKVVQIYSTTRDTGFSQFTIIGRSIKVEK